MIHCNFCNSTPEQVSFMVQSKTTPSSYICTDCIKQAVTAVAIGSRDKRSSEIAAT